MKISAIHSLLVHPTKGEDDPHELRGTRVGLSGPLFKMLAGVFDNAPRECRYEIAFQPKEGKQTNGCRSLLLRYMQRRGIAEARAIAQRLRGVTSGRSGMGLLFLMFGSAGTKSRLVVSRFPADHGILAEENQSSLSVEFIERVFMKSVTSYKSAVYEGASDADFWLGRAVDKQINSDLTIANYWIRDFLASDFATTGERGTRRLATAIRDAVNRTESIPIKEELTAAARLVRTLDKQVLSAAQFAERYGLTEPTRAALKLQMKDALFDEPFQFVADEFAKHVAFHSVELSNGALLTADADRFEQVFVREESPAGGVTFSTTGKIVDERLKKSKT